MPTSMFMAVALLLTFATPEQRPAHGGTPQAAQHAQSKPRANEGHLPPAPRARPQGDGTERYNGGRSNSFPHVNHDQWFGHEVLNDPRYRQSRPFERGTFGHAGAGFRYRVLRVDRELHRFWITGGYYFVVAPWDWPFFADWCWDCGDDFVIYDDPLHPGWYLLYNVYTGMYVHVQYWGM